MADWSFLTNHARALLCIAHDPGARLRDIAARLKITERRAFEIVTYLTDAGYVLKEKDGPVGTATGSKTSCRSQNSIGR